MRWWKRTSPVSDATPAGMPFGDMTMFLVLGGVASVAAIAITAGVLTLNGGVVVETVDEPTPLLAANVIDSMLKLMTRAESAVVELRELGPVDGNDPDFRTREEPLPVNVNDYSSSLGKGWIQVSSNTMGEWVIRTYLEEYLDEDRAAAAAAGWSGDAYSLLSGPESKRVLVARIVWDSQNEASEFFAAYKVFGEIKAQTVGGTSQPLDSTTATWTLPDQTIFLGLSGQAEVWLIISEEPDLMQSLNTLIFDDKSSGP